MSIDIANGPILRAIYVSSDAVQYKTPDIMAYGNTAKENEKPLTIERKTKNVIEKRETIAVKINPPALCFLLYCFISVASVIPVEAESNIKRKPITGDLQDFYLII